MQFSNEFKVQFSWDFYGEKRFIVMVLGAATGGDRRGLGQRMTVQQKQCLW